MHFLLAMMVHITISSVIYYQRFLFKTDVILFVIVKIWTAFFSSPEHRVLSELL